MVQFNIFDHGDPIIISLEFPTVPELLCYKFTNESFLLLQDKITLLLTKTVDKNSCTMSNIPGIKKHSHHIWAYSNDSCLLQLRSNKSSQAGNCNMSGTITFTRSTLKINQTPDGRGQCQLLSPAVTERLDLQCTCTPEEDVKDKAV